MSIEDCIYAIIAIPKNILVQMPEDVEVQFGPANGINGTCFFVTPDEFVTAHHVFNSQYFADNLYVIINSKGKIYTDIDFLEENPDSDMSIGKLSKSKTSYLTGFISVVKNKAYTAYGFSRNDTQKLRLTAIKKDGKLVISKADRIHLKTVKYNCLGVQHYAEIKSSDGYITLRNCNIVIFDNDSEVGFSGGPTLDSNGEIIGFTSFNVKANGKEGIAVIPIRPE
jgi:V8-like Glu-specific endopeptidase